MLYELTIPLLASATALWACAQMKAVAGWVLCLALVLVTVWLDGQFRAAGEPRGWR